MFQRILKKYLARVADVSRVNPMCDEVRFVFTPESAQIFYFALCFNMTFRLNWSAGTVTWL